MQPLENRRVLLGITGGIAAYKGAELCRRLRGLGAEVQVVMTPAATDFITPLTLQALSGRPVRTALLDPAAEAAMGHIELARWAELLLVAPATADFMARLAQGHANDLLSTTCLATDAPIALAPAMNQAMWRAAATQRNAAQLEADGVHLWGPGSGDQACGDTGPGRMLEAEDLAERTLTLLAPARFLADRTVVVTAGPTREAIDPVRYISNHSSGKQGFALARAAAEAGARVILVSGPVSLPTPPGTTRIDVGSAREMLDAALEASRDADVFIAVAAVADYRPAEVAEHKLKKEGASQGAMDLQLVANPDIVATVAAGGAGGRRPFTVAFAAETRDLIPHARRKLERKGVDLVVANDVSVAGIGFGSDDNRVTLVDARGEEALPRMGKDALARLILQRIGTRLTQERPSGASAVPDGVG
ncbi:MAG: bifunctional phosphopantothenoylcysteine decarboxylase/phosphopantothenate--cysteine ligase CoaBC [Pseudomonadales bacterium]|jgi:phosphopantothenoylcysteine decarboxylase/phosphopantothenate--cysteine ligase|nr:bifunctional phosphopantothenoylcysteine decarboxylase/phosphopantothenate--cysteine ligase CoaBC [Pseudomonadales bacterium]